MCSPPPVILAEVRNSIKKTVGYGYTDLVRVDQLTRYLILLLSAIALLWAPQAVAQKTATQQAPATPEKPPHKPSTQEIAEAKAKGLVWVNTATRVFHREGSSYGTTSLGRFMTEDEARRAGYRPASEPGNQKAKRGAAVHM